MRHQRFRRIQFCYQSIKPKMQPITSLLSNQPSYQLTTLLPSWKKSWRHVADNLATSPIILLAIMILLIKV